MAGLPSIACRGRASRGPEPMARTTRPTPPEGALATTRGVAGPAPAGVRMEARGVREAPERWNLVGGRSTASDRLLLARPGRLLGSDPRTGAEGTSLETSPGAFEAAPPTEAIELDRLGGDLLRRRWRSVIGRHPPKTLSSALMVRILTWREQVLEVGDVSPRSRAILAAAIRGKDERAETGGEPELGPIAHASRPRMPRPADRLAGREEPVPATGGAGSAGAGARARRRRRYARLRRTDARPACRPNRREFCSTSPLRSPRIPIVRTRSRGSRS